jgi:hypothetical protein
MTTWRPSRASDIGAGEHGCVIASLDPTGLGTGKSNYTETNETIDTNRLVVHGPANVTVVRPWERSIGNSMAPRPGIPYIWSVSLDDDIRL